MNGNGNEALAQAQEMLAESGRLDITARRKLWQAMGALEVRYGANVIQRTSARKISSKKALLTLTGKLPRRNWLPKSKGMRLMILWCWSMMGKLPQRRRSLRGKQPLWPWRMKAIWNRGVR